MRCAKEYDPRLDPGIEHQVEVLAEAGVETYESCQGGPGHAYAEPAVRFHGERAEGFRALAAAMENGLKVSALRRVWAIEDGEPTGPTWELVFYDAPGWVPPYLADPQQQTCKVCGKRDKFDFHVTDEVWATVVPPDFRTHVVCLACFDSYAALRNVRYELEKLCFAGHQSFEVGTECIKRKDGRA